MKRFTQLFRALDATTKTERKLEALEHYFASAPARDAAHGLSMLCGGTLARLATGTELRTWAADEAGLPLWIVEESYASVGDLAETLALIVPENATPNSTDIGLADLIEHELAPLARQDGAIRRAAFVELWRKFDRDERLVLNKLVTGSFRVGAARTRVLEALARSRSLDPSLVAHRFLGGFEPTSEAFERLLAAADVALDRPRPYPFCLAHALEGEPGADASFGSSLDWQVEWKWDGIRAQVLRKSGETMVWTRGEELVTHRWPELAQLGDRLPDGVALDGEILAWRDASPLSFLDLQKRIHKEKPGPKLMRDVPARFVAYDVLEEAGADLRARPLRERRERLERIVATIGDEALVMLSPRIEFGDWSELAAFRDRARELGREGLMLKRLDSAYAPGRVTGVWWKWKVAPFSVDAVLIYAQLGHGRRAELHTDYTFGVWHEGRLVPFAKAYSGLTDAELRKLDTHIRRTTTAKHGPVREVEPRLVFEVAFENVQASARHKCGLAVRFPRILRQRSDKKPEDADTLESLRRLVRAGASA